MVGPIYGLYRTLRWVQAVNENYDLHPPPPPGGGLFRDYVQPHTLRQPRTIVQGVHLKLEPALTASYRARDDDSFLVFDQNTLPPHDSGHTNTVNTMRTSQYVALFSGLCKQQNLQKSACLEATILRSHTPSTTRI
jgi:hypothetical protein